MSKTRQERPHVQMHYTVTPIGGKADLDKWKVERKQIEDEWQASVIKTRQERRLAAMEYVASQAGRKLTEEEKAEIHSTTVTLVARTAKPTAYEYLPYQEAKPKRTISQKVVDFVKKALFPDTYK